MTATVAAIHGLRGSSRDWFRLVPRLREELGDAGCSFALLTLPGHRPEGRAPSGLAKWSFAEIHREVARQLDELEDLTCIVAHSWGARLALEYAAERPRRRIVVALVAPYFERVQLMGLGRWTAAHPRGAMLLQRALTRLRVPSRRFLRSTLFEEYASYVHEGRPAAEFLAGDQEGTAPGAWQAFADTPDFDARSRLDECGSVPDGPRFLLFWSSDDRMLAPSSYGRLEGRLREARVLLDAIEGADGGHNPQIHRPDAIARAIAGHVRRDARSEVSFAGSTGKKP